MAGWAEDYVLITNTPKPDWHNWDKIPHHQVIEEFMIEGVAHRDYIFPKGMYLLALEHLGVRPFIFMSGEPILD